MRNRNRPRTPAQVDTAREREVQREIQGYIEALHSYADRAAREPRLSFEQHLFSIITAADSPEPVGHDRRR